MKGPASTAIVVALLVVHAALALSAMRDASATCDENLHIAAGLSYWKFDDYRLQPENGNLPQRWCALPLLATGCVFPIDEARWRMSDGYGLGQKLLYGGVNDPARVLFAARAMAVVWSTALCLVVFLWSRSLFGFAGGLVSLALAAFWPAVVAHGALATSDVCGALFFTLATWCLWNLLQLVSPATLAMACGSVGLAAIAKHSSVLLAPVAVVFLLVRLCDGRPIRVTFDAETREVATPARKLGLGLAVLTATLLAAAACIWASCGFRYAAGHRSAPPFRFFTYPTLEWSTAFGGGIGQICQALGDWRLLPEAWLWGMSQVAARASSRFAFALGENSRLGWWWFFPLCLAIKNTLPSLMLSLWGLATFGRKTVDAISRRLPLDAATYDSIPLVITLAVLWPTFLTSHLNIGERHLLPSYPPLMILAGGIWRAAGPAWPRVLISMLLVLHAIDVTSRWPATLAYFNQIVPRGQEYRWLVDSSLDWGQDLGRLARWLERHRRDDEPLYVSYFGGAPAASALTDFEYLGALIRPGQRQRLSPGLYCVSASVLQGVGDRLQGPWCRTFESTWLKVADYVSHHQTAPDEAAAATVIDEVTKNRDELNMRSASGSVTAHERLIMAFNILQASRLRAFLRQRSPDATLGGSILIWRLTADDLDAAVAGAPAELAEQSWFEREGYGKSDELLALGRNRLAVGDAAGARDVFRPMTIFYPGDPRAWRGLAEAYGALGRLADAERARTEAERLRLLLRRSAGAL